MNKIIKFLSYNISARIREAEGLIMRHGLDKDNIKMDLRGTELEGAVRIRVASKNTKDVI
jgi:hypothetical protein